MKFHFKKNEPPPNISASDWLDWRWQLRSSPKNAADFAKYFLLSAEESAGFAGGKDIFQVRATPYYIGLTDRENSKDPIRRILMPSSLELKRGRQQMLDPLGERKNSPVPRIIHRYPDRVLFLVTDTCTVYCRYCTRKHFTGKDQAVIAPDEYAKALNYISEKKGIREVILSGGDPLTLNNDRLDQILKDLRAIEHIEIIRLGSRVPVVAPMRVDSELAKICRKYAPVFIMTHFNHPRELTHEAAEAIGVFVDHGVPVFNQMVLLNGINNHPAIVQALSRRLLYLRAKPYYMFQCDPSEGTDHLRTSVDESLAIQRELWGRLSGLAMPNLSLDIPEGGGKVGLVPDFLLKKEKDTRHYRGWDNIESVYIDPDPALREEPTDASIYIDEWDELCRSN